MEEKPLTALAVLVSGGLDSAILLGESIHSVPEVYPVYVRQGLYWEPAELACLRQFLVSLGRPTLKALVILEMPVADLYGAHWSLTGPVLRTRLCIYRAATS